MIIRIGTVLVVSEGELAECVAVAQGKNRASQRAGAVSEATRRCAREPEDIMRQSMVAEKAFERLTGLQMDTSFFHRSVERGTDHLSDFRVPGIGNVDIKSTRTPYAPLEVRLQSTLSHGGKAPPDAYVLMDVRDRIVTFRGIVDANTVVLEATRHARPTQAGRVDDVLLLSRKFLRHLECDEDKRWWIVEDGKLF